jgi:hypothetical protein
MPSFLPLNNAVAQNSVDFNNQTPTNANALFRYKVNNRNNNYYFTASDLNGVCIFNSGGTAAGSVNNVFLNSNSFSPVPPVGAEIIFYSTTNHINIRLENQAVLRNAKGTLTSGANKVGKIIHVGANVWYFSSAAYRAVEIGLGDCCNGSPYLYQVSAPDTTISFNSSFLSYTNDSLNALYNGTVSAQVPDTDPQEYTYYKIVNGKVASSGSECTPENFNTGYNFFDSPDPIYGAPVTLYSVSGLSLDPPEDLLGYKFFTQDVGSQYDCYTANQANTTYYTNDVAPYYSITFTNGYVTSYSYTPEV